MRILAIMKWENFAIIKAYYLSALVLDIACLENKDGKLPFW